MKIGLIKNWRTAHKLGSVQISAAMVAVLTLGHSLEDEWSRMPQDLKDALPHGTARIVAIAAFALVILARLVVFGETVQGGSDAAN